MNCFRILAVFTAFALVACKGSKSGSDAGSDAGEEEAIEYEGDSSGAPPDFSGDIIDAGNKSEIDAGEIVVDTRCCKLSFRIDVGDEPANASARLIGQAAPLSPGIELTKVTGGYVANACFPMESSTYYYYEFQWVSDDGGTEGLDLGDGGFLITSRRESTYETSYPVGDGTRNNFIPAVEDCATLDAGQGL